MSFPGSLAVNQDLFRHSGVEPKGQQVLVLKGTVHSRTHFQHIAEEILVAFSPGGHIVDSDEISLSSPSPACGRIRLGRIQAKGGDDLTVESRSPVGIRFVDCGD